MRRTSGDRFFDFINIGLLCVGTLAVLYPLYFIIIASVSNPDAVNAGKVLLFPKDVTLLGYVKIFSDARIWYGYRNTIFYTVSATLLGVMVTLMTGYSLSRKDFLGRNLIMGFLVFTMYFQGGLIPTYLIVKNLGLVNTPWVMIIFGCVGVWNIIITRTFFQSTLSPELLEAAFIDGCTNQRFFFQIVLPLSRAIIAVQILYYAVGHWNQFFRALIYLNDRKLYPLQIILREILIQSEMIEADLVDINDFGAAERYAELIKFGVIIVSSLPVLMIYPFVQRHFVRGVMIGAIKG